DDGDTVVVGAAEQHRQQFRPDEPGGPEKECFLHGDDAKRDGGRRAIVRLDRANRPNASACTDPRPFEGRAMKGRRKPGKPVQLPLSWPSFRSRLAIKGTLNERTCLPRLPATRADGMRRFPVVNWLE